VGILLSEYYFYLMGMIRGPVNREAFAAGILMWLLSQGGKVEVIGSEDLKISWPNESMQIL